MNFATWLEQKSHYSYSSTHVDLPELLANEIIKWGKDHILDTDLYQDPEDQNNSRETTPHVTILYGIRDTTAQKVRYKISNEKPFEITLGKISLFENEKFDVVKIEVKSDTLHELNKLMKDEFSHREMFPNYSPHATIAYVKKGTCKRLKNNEKFLGEKFTAKQIVFSNKNNNKSVLTLRGRCR